MGEKINEEKERERESLKCCCFFVVIMKNGIQEQFRIYIFITWLLRLDSKSAAKSSYYLFVRMKIERQAWNTHQENYHFESIHSYDIIAWHFSCTQNKRACNLLTLLLSNVTIFFSSVCYVLARKNDAMIFRSYVVSKRRMLWHCGCVVAIF